MVCPYIIKTNLFCDTIQNNNYDFYEVGQNIFVRRDFTLGDIISEFEAEKIFLLENLTEKQRRISSGVVSLDDKIEGLLRPEIEEEYKNKECLDLIQKNPFTNMIIIPNLRISYIDKITESEFYLRVQEFNKKIISGNF